MSDQTTASATDAPSSASNATPCEAEHKPKGVLHHLGLIGLSSIEAPILAALATEEPLLLIGPHGTAKSLLLTRIATAMGLEFRHYNASLLNFDDLIGFPLPGKDGRLEYLSTPAAVWGAGAVIFDEVSRCRPDILADDLALLLRDDMRRVAQRADFSAALSRLAPEGARPSRRGAQTILSLIPKA